MKRPPVMLCEKLVLRHTSKGDRDAIRAVESAAFGRDTEAVLAERLIAGPDHTISLLAECDDRPIGHVLVTEIGAPLKACALAPIGVIGEFREMQVGSTLVRSAIDAARLARFEAMFVLGDVLFYERFGFSSRLADGFDVAWQGPHFMALELLEGALEEKSGRLDYPAAFFSV